MKVLVLLVFCLYTALSTANRIHVDANQINPFDTLDDYSLLGILDWVDDFCDVATFASLSPRFRQLIWDYSRASEPQIVNTSLHIVIEGGRVVEAIRYHSAHGFFKHTLCMERYHILATLKAYCPVLRRLEIRLDYTSPHDDFTLEVIDYVNRYCSTTPQKISIMWPRNAVHEFTAWNVTSVEIQLPEEIADFSIAKHFPSVEKLSITNDDNFTTTEHLPHLKHLELWDSSCGHFNFRSFAEKNPQITSAKLALCDGLDNLQEVNELLPNLVSLHYRPRKGLKRMMGQNVDQLVHFRNVQSYTIDLLGYFKSYISHNDSYYDPYFAGFSRITFDQMETFTYISWNIFYQYGQLDFVGQYKEVKSLDYSFQMMTYDQIWHLVDSLPNLKVIQFQLHNDLAEHGDLLRLMEETSLETIRIQVNIQFVYKFRALSRPSQWILDIGKSKFDHFKLVTFSRN